MGKKPENKNSLGDTVTRRTDRLIPKTICDGNPDILRRARLLILTSGIMFVVNSLYLAYMVITVGSDHPLIAVVLLASMAYISIPVVLKRTASLLTSGWLLMVSIVGLIGISAYFGGGFNSPSLPWSASVPLLATFVVGPLLGAACAAMLVVNTLVLFYLEQSGTYQPMAPSQDGLFLTVMSITTSLGFVALLAWLFDTERRGTTQRLYISEQRFRRLAEHSADAILVHDETGRVVDANKRASMNFGYDNRTLCSMQITDLGLDADHLPLLQSMSSHSVLSLESVFRCGDGGLVPVDLRISVFHHASERLYILSARDVTPRKFAAEALKKAKDEADRANQAKSQFLSNMSHEMRTPLNSIIGFARVLDKGTFGPLTSQQSEFTRDIVDAGEHMLALVNELLDFQVIDDGRLTLELEYVDPSRIIQEAVMLVRADVDSRQHALELEIPENLPKIRVDRRALLQAVTNLLSNAAKYTHPGGHIRVSIASDDGLLYVSVTDDGIGIDPTNQKRIFNFFERVENSVIDSQGSGIGLALTRQLILRLGGRIGVESKLGKGATFWFTIPNKGTEHEPMKGISPS